MSSDPKNSDETQLQQEITIAPTPAEPTLHSPTPEAATSRTKASSPPPVTARQKKAAYLRDSLLVDGLNGAWWPAHAKILSEEAADGGSTKPIGTGKLMEIFRDKWNSRFIDEADDWTAAPGTLVSYAWTGIARNQIPWTVLKAVWRREPPLPCGSCKQPTLLVNFGSVWALLNRYSRFRHVCLQCGSVLMNECQCRPGSHQSTLSPNPSSAELADLWVKQTLPESLWPTSWSSR